MMEIRTNANNLDQLKKKINSAKKEILICSAWIRGETLDRIFSEKTKNKIKSKEIKLRLIIRLGRQEDVEISGNRLFTFIDELGDNCEVRYHQTLHSKFYIVDDDYGLLGSFNLTGGGFGNAYRKGSNIERGVEYTDPAIVLKLKDEFETIWNDHARPIPKTLLGFCLNETNERELYCIGIKPLESGQFIQINISESEIILGQISQSIKVNPDYFKYPSEDEEDVRDIQKIFGNQSSLTNAASGIAEREKNYDMMFNIGHVKIKSRLIIKESNSGLLITSDVNRIAPDVGAEILSADKHILESYFTYSGSKPAVLISNQSVNVGFDEQEILSKHMAVFGSTGSGKSYFVKRYIAKYLTPWIKKQNGRIIILDPHGEYASGKDFNNVLSPQNILPNKQIKTNLSTRVINDIEDLKEVCDLPVLNKQQKDYLLSRLILAKRNTKKFVKAISTKGKSSGDINIEWEKYLTDDIAEIFYQYLTTFGKIADKRVENEIAEGCELKGDEKKKRKKEIILELYNKLPQDDKDLIKKKIINNQLKNIEQEFKSDVSPVLTDEIIQSIQDAHKAGMFQLESHNFVDLVEKPDVYCINFQTVNDEQQKYELAADILKGAFEKAKNSNHVDGFKTLFIVEEAHNFVPESGSRKNNPAFKYLKTIASEGRKFGVGIIIITQRPAYVSKNILSQCNTQAIFRLINPNDINAVKETVEGISSEELYRLPHYIQGQCIFTGVGIKEPVVVKVKP